MNKIIASLLTVVGIISGILQIIFGFGNPLIGIFIIIAIFLVVVLASTHNYWRPVQLLYTTQQLHRSAKELIERSKEIVFCGKLENDLLQIFIDAFEKRREQKGVDNSLSLKILNCDPAFYTRGEDSMTKTLLDLDAQYTDEVFSHKFYLYKQNVSFLLGKSGARVNFILFFPAIEQDYNGVYVRRGLTFDFSKVLVENAGPTINMVKQLTNICSIAEKSLEFWSPLKNGWFQPVFPPDDVDKVREIWRDRILEWFNKTAQELLANGGDLKVTWRIVKRSLEDAKSFREWLNYLKLSRSKVTRYMLVSKSQYIGDVEYKQVTNEIVKNYLPVLPTTVAAPYLVYFINSDVLPPSLKDDFAFFTLPNQEKIAQDSIRDVKGDVEVLKVLFSRDYGFVKTVEHKFSLFLKYAPQSTLDALID